MYKAQLTTKYIGILYANTSLLVFYNNFYSICTIFIICCRYSPYVVLENYHRESTFFFKFYILHIEKHK